MKNINTPGFFDEQFQLELLTQLKDPLVKLEQYIDWKIFAPILDIVFSKSENRSNAGRPPYDRVMMFKLLILQSLYTIFPMIRWNSILMTGSVSSGFWDSNKVNGFWTERPSGSSVKHSFSKGSLKPSFTASTRHLMIRAYTPTLDRSLMRALLKCLGNATAVTKTTRSKRARPRSCGILHSTGGKQSRTNYARKTVMPAGQKRTR
jgi:hypothetical protein